MSRTRSFCYVTLDDTTATYSPGDLIKGKVICHFTTPLKIREVRVQLGGLESTEWSYRVLVRQNNINFYEIHHVHSRNKILHNVLRLTEKGTYDPGEHVYPFTFQLPEVLPSTFSGEYGTINFYIKGIVNIPFARDFTYEKKIIVECSIDLNAISWLNPGPVRYTIGKTLRGLFSSLGTVTMDVCLEKAALSPGESTELRIKLKNSSREDVRAVEGKIVMTTFSFCTNRVRKPKVKHDTLAIVCDCGIDANQEKTYLFRLVLPKFVQVKNLQGSKLFHRWTHLDVRAVIDGLHTDLTLSIPIKMGNIPFRASQNEIQRAFSASSFNFLWESSSETDEKCQTADSALCDTFNLEPSTFSEVSGVVDRGTSE